MLRIIFIFILFLSITLTHASSPYDTIEVDEFIDYMHDKHTYDKQKLRNLFKNVKAESRLKKFFKRAPERTLTWNGCDKTDINCTNYKNLFVNKSHIKQGKDFWNKNEYMLNKAYKMFGVPPEIIIAIIGIETKFGQRTGNFKTFDTLASLSMGPNKGRRAKFFKSELINFLLLCKENNLNPEKIKGSYAGALGKPQFISSSYRNYAIDFDNDKKIDLWNSNADAIGSVANYLYKHGWKKNNLILSHIIYNEDSSELVRDFSKKSYKPHTKYKYFKDNYINSKEYIYENSLISVIARKEQDGNVYSFGHKNFYVITRYNRSRLYALAVHFLGKNIKSYKIKPN
ncbi:MAG: lytic murein transglycosylase B [Gammaproteobacteria bacterium]|nr:lytic murein transglycosylase B [Gammaproteobacteria bacterium]|tara:strand:- start:1042 stop:2070 length:1029 start_codon:yes stop_codon:yes gene_type:complete